MLTVTLPESAFRSEWFRFVAVPLFRVARRGTEPVLKSLLFNEWLRLFGPVLSPVVSVEVVEAAALEPAFDDSSDALPA